MAISDKLNTIVVENVLKTGVNFFMENPAYRIVYRMSQDQMVLDSKLSVSMYSGIVSLLLIFSGMLIMNYVYYGIFFVLSIGIFYYLYYLLQKYLWVIVHVLQFRDRSRSKLVYTYVKTLNAVITLRGIGKSKLYEKEFLQFTDLFQ